MLSTFLLAVFTYRISISLPTKRGLSLKVLKPLLTNQGPFWLGQLLKLTMAVAMVGVGGGLASLPQLPDSEIGSPAWEGVRTPELNLREEASNQPQPQGSFPLYRLTLVLSQLWFPSFFLSSTTALLSLGLLAPASASLCLAPSLSLKEDLQALKLPSTLLRRQNYYSL